MKSIGCIRSGSYCANLAQQDESPLPKRVADITLGWGIGIYTSWMQRKVVRDLDAETAWMSSTSQFRFPQTAVSDVRGRRAVVIGPMNGGMNYPPGFSKSQGLFERWLMRAGRIASHTMNAILPGKRKAAVLLVANQRTRQVLPRGIRGEVIELTENGVDFSVFRRAEDSRFGPSGSSEFAFVGRLIEWKGVDLLLEATARALRQPRARIAYSW